MNKSKLFLNQKGVSLVEVMVAAGISSVIALGTMKINETSQQGMRNVATKSELNNYVNFKIGSALGESTACLGAFDTDGNGTPGNTISLTLNGSADIKKIQVGSLELAEVGKELPSTSGEFNVDKISFRRDADTACTLTLDLSRNKADRKIGGKHLKKEIAMGCAFDDTGSNELQTCSTKGTSELGKWSYLDSSGATWLQNEEGAAAIGTYNPAGGSAYPVPRLVVTPDDANTNDWNGLEDAIGLPSNYVLRWGAINKADDGVGIYGDSNCLNVKAGGASAPHFSTCDSTNSSASVTESDSSEVGSFRVVNDQGQSANFEMNGSGTGGFANSVIIRGGNANTGKMWFRMPNTGTNDFQFSHGTADRLVIKGVTGRVGIGTTAPGSKLEVVEGGIRTAVNPNTSLGSSVIGSMSNHDTTLIANNQQVVKIKPNGNVGIGLGSASPTTTLDISGTAAATALVVDGSGPGGDFTSNPQWRIFQSSGTNDLYIGKENYNGVVKILRTGNVLEVTGSTTVNNTIHANGRGVFNSLYVTGVGVASAWNTHSDRRFKTNIEELDEPLQKVLSLQPVQYDWRGDYVSLFGDKKQYGLIAQEVRKVYPAIVQEGEGGFLSVNYTALIAPIIDSVKSLYNKIVENDKKDLERDRKIASLEAENKELKERLERLEGLVLEER